MTKDERDMLKCKVWTIAAVVLCVLYTVWYWGYAVPATAAADRKQAPTPAVPQIVPANVSLEFDNCEVHDGDTLEVTMSYRFAVRVMGIDCPELADKREHAAGVVARDAAYAFMKAGKQSDIHIKKPDKYGGRYIGVVEVDGEALADYMLRNKLAHPYDGGKKSEWTDAELKAIEAWKAPQ